MPRPVKKNACGHSYLYEIITYNLREMKLKTNQQTHAFDFFRERAQLVLSYRLIQAPWWRHSFFLVFHAKLISENFVHFLVSMIALMDWRDRSVQHTDDGSHSSFCVVDPV